MKESPVPSNGSVLAPPFCNIFENRAEAEWAFHFLRQSLDLMGADANGYKSCVMTLPKEHKNHLLRLNVGMWLVIDFAGSGCKKYGRRVHLALIIDDSSPYRDRQWYRFDNRRDYRGVALYHFTFEEVRAMDNWLAPHYVESMRYVGSLFGGWAGSPYARHHQHQVFASVLDPGMRASLFTHGMDPLIELELKESGDAMRD